MADAKIREVYFTEEFNTFFESLDDKVKQKYLWTMHITETIKDLPSTYVKKLVDSNFYEMRVCVANNQYRTVIFTTDTGNITSAKEVYLLNSFLKRSTKDYKKQVKIATKLLEELL